MSSRKENTRICCMCGSPPFKDPSVTLHRFPKPGSENALRCELWVKYCFPNEAWSSPKFQDRLHSKLTMLCSKHFIRSCFNEKKLFRTAVPGDQCHQITPTLPQHPVEPVITQTLPQDSVEPVAGHSHQWLLSDVTYKDGRNDPQVECTEHNDDAVDDSATLVHSNVCRVCLTLDVKMYDLKDIELSEMFQNVTGIVVTENNHSILERLCWECAGRLKAAAGFRNKALLSDALLQGLADTGEQIQKKYITSIKENADYLKSAGTLSVVEVFRTVEIEPENESVPPISENNDTDIVQNIVRKDSMELAEVFEDGLYQMDVENESIIEDDHIICPNTGETNPIVVNKVPFREDTTNSAYSSPQVEPKKRILGYLCKTSSDSEDMTKKPVIKITKRDLISKIVYRKSNPVISHHHTLICDAKLKNINVKEGGICKKTSNLKLVKKSRVKRNTSTDKECISLEKK